jgi:hypothetical protein
MAGFGGGHCFPYPLSAVIIILAVVHAIIASIASLQVIFSPFSFIFGFFFINLGFSFFCLIVRIDRWIRNLV